MEGLYIIKSKNTFFLVKVKKSFSEGDYDIRVSPVSRRDGEEIITDDACLTIEISSSFSEYSAMIDYVGFHEGCSLFDPMERGVGTRDMIKSTLSLCKKLFGISKFTLYDASQFDCPETGGGVGLAVHNLLVYGKSWYERKFGAAPSSSHDSLIWEQSKKLLSSVVEESKARRIKGVIEGIFQGNDQERFLEIVNDAVIERITWHQMFENMNLSHNGCVFFTGRMIDTVTVMFGIPMVHSWYIPINDEDASEYLVAYEKISPYD